MGKPLSPDRVFDFPEDEPEPHPAYDFFAPGPLPKYTEDEPMVGPIVDEIAEPIEEVWEVNKEWLMALITPPLMPVVPPPRIYEVQVMASHMVYVMNRFEQIGTQTMTQSDEVIAGLTQQVQALQVAVQQRDSQIQQLQTMVLEMSSRKSTLMQCIIRMEKRLTDLERRPPGPQ
nr:hypothetical protein [Tanacetum cinerariifolium]